MKATMAADDVRCLLGIVGDAMVQSSDELRDLDSAVGDGDLGVTIAIGGRVLKEVAGASEVTDIGGFLISAGVKFNQAAASTFGVLFATSLMEAGKILRGKTEVALADAVAASEAALAGIMKRGNAKQGDKTMIDAAAPAVQALRRAEADRQDWGEAFSLALEAAREGTRATKLMVSRLGRASWLGNKSVGKEDPGAVAICKILEAVTEYAKR